MGMHLKTKRGHDLAAVISAMQKAIRRNDPRVAGYFAMELHTSGFAAYAWRRLLITSAEDCAGLVTQEVKALFDSWEVVGARMADKERWKLAGRVFMAKAVILLCTAAKSRDADYLANLVHEARAISDAEVERLVKQSAGAKLDVPDYAYDCHTGRGKRAGKTRHEFFLAEDAALSPRALSLFDEDLDRLRRGELTAADRNWSKK